MLCIINPKDAAKKLLEFISDFGKVAGHKMNAQKFLASLYTKNKRSETLRKQYHLPSHQK